MAFIPSGTIRTYMSMKSIIAAYFSDKERDPYVTMNKLNDKVTVTIRRKGQKTITHSVRISDIEYLTQVYDQIHQMAFGKHAIMDKQSYYVKCNQCKFYDSSNFSEHHGKLAMCKSGVGGKVSCYSLACDDFEPNDEWRINNE